jgi:hypothetical protein
MTVSIGTVRDLIDHHDSLTAWGLGLDHSTMRDDLTPKLRCSKCRDKRVGLILSYDDPRQRKSNSMAGSSN